MTELGTTRDPRKARSTATSTAATIGIPGMILLQIMPDLSAEAILAIAAVITTVLGWVGKAARDSEFSTIAEEDKGSLKGFLVTLCAKALG